MALISNNTYIRRSPVFVLLDTSGSMQGNCFEEGLNWIKNLIVSLRTDPYKLETVSLCIIGFNEKSEVLVPYREIWESPNSEDIEKLESLHLEGKSNLDQAFTFLSQQLDILVNRPTIEKKGDWRAELFIISNGSFSNNLSSGLQNLKKQWYYPCCYISNSGYSVPTFLSAIIDYTSSVNFFDYRKYEQKTRCDYEEYYEESNDLVPHFPPPPPEVNIKF